MKKITYMILAAAMAAGGASCSKETPFEPGRAGDGYGRVLTSSLTVEVKTDEKLVRASAVPEVEQFTVEFYDTTNDTTPVESYTYGDMPEVVTLPVGTYTARAYYGGDYGSEGAVAAFDAPYYLGTSEEFTIEKDKIVDNIAPITCKLSNVKVTIIFDDTLVHAMGEDSKVSVKVGDSGSLDFAPSTTESGFFAYVEGSNTLVATFIGTVDGDEVEEPKTYNNVQPGNHYRITFKLNSADASDPGDINHEGFKVSASVNVVDKTGDPENVDPGDEDIKLDDDLKEDPTKPENPKPDDPTPPTPAEGPTVKANDGINLNDWNDVDATSSVVLTINSETGLKVFTVDVDSETLDLSEVGLVNHLDLINPGEILGALQGLGLMKADQESLLGLTKCTFDISGFMPLLSPAFIGDHKFVLTIGDESGTREIELKLRVKS